ncbi:hypothetical protein E2K20_25860 [Vibrio parahaemolyticus]|nr:hypothetical protein [Vibrio parahaemolyticus]
MKAGYLKPYYQPNAHKLFAIQEPQKPLCFSQGFNYHEIRSFSDKVAFEPEKPKATKWQQKQEPLLTCPYHTLSQ